MEDVHAFRHGSMRNIVDRPDPLLIARWGLGTRLVHVQLKVLLTHVHVYTYIMYGRRTEHLFIHKIRNTVLITALYMYI